MKQQRRWLIMCCLCFAGSMIYLLTYLREFFELPMQTALKINDRQMSLLSSILGLGSFICYFPGGWLADRISPRKLLSFSLVVTGCGGLYMATFPPYSHCILVFVGWSIFSILTFWAGTDQSHAKFRKRGRTRAGLRLS